MNWPKYRLLRIGPLFENGAPQRQAVGTFDVCLARPNVCSTDIVRPHAAQLMIDTSVNIMSTCVCVRACVRACVRTSERVST